MSTILREVSNSNKLGRRCVDAYQLLFCPDQIAAFRMTASNFTDQIVNGLDGTSIDGFWGQITPLIEIPECKERVHHRRVKGLRYEASN